VTQALSAIPVASVALSILAIVSTSPDPLGTQAIVLNSAGERVDLDQADVTEITRLPRVGPALARRIVDWRAQHGPFGSLARLDSVSGIGPHMLEAIRPYVIFSGSLPSVP